MLISVRPYEQGLATPAAVGTHRRASDLQEDQQLLLDLSMCPGVLRKDVILTMMFVTKAESEWVSGAPEGPLSARPAPSSPDRHGRAGDGYLQAGLTGRGFPQPASPSGGFRQLARRAFAKPVPRRTIAWWASSLAALSSTPARPSSGAATTSKPSSSTFLGGARKAMSIAVPPVDSRPIAQAILEAERRRNAGRGSCLEGDYLTEEKALADPWNSPGRRAPEENRIIQGALLKSEDRHQSAT